LIVERRYMELNKLHLQDGRCTSCGTAIAGVWS